MNLTRHRENGFDRLQITDPLPEELFSGELLRAIWEGRSMPWAWRDPVDLRVVRFVDDFGTRLAYEVAGWDRDLDTFRLKLRIGG